MLRIVPDEALPQELALTIDEIVAEGARRMAAWEAAVGSINSTGRSKPGPVIEADTGPFACAGGPVHRSGSRPAGLVPVAIG